ncbi:hypothetical protein H632_c1737p0 [Helicosporidium sp. ATCC 50920]|nr:hypothetical protein H632_c1737p0 [Helicosporidium sp. ATCC 50920]|eukprot:KDD73912.1 hypothetical protein H632_c1737p0 [Helicosporidium sp. ATCC 50920]
MHTLSSLIPASSPAQQRSMATTMAHWSCARVARHAIRRNLLSGPLALDSPSNAISTRGLARTYASRAHRNAVSPWGKVSPWWKNQDALDAWNPSSLLSEWEALDTARGRFQDFQRLLPLALNVEHADDELTITADLPGMRREDIHVEVSPQGLLTISGSREHQDSKESGGRVVRLERSYGSFSRSIQLPEHARVKEMKASLEQGVLTLLVPLQEIVVEQPHVVEIESVEGAKNAAKASQNVTVHESKEE